MSTTELLRAMIELAPTRSDDTMIRSGVSFDVARLRRASWAYTTRRVGGEAFGFVGDARPPQAGDLVLARVESIGHHTSLQLPDGRRKRLFVGDEIVVAYGNRYAPNQFEAVVPRTQGPCQLVAAGGVAGRVLSWHTSITRSPTQLQPVGLVAGPGGVPLNLRDHALPRVDRVATPCPLAIVVAGTSMDSGKTETSAFLAKGLSLAGLRIGYAKITGTGAGGDPWLLRDAGADPVVDFTDAGVVSTSLLPAIEVQRILVTLVDHLARSRVGAMVLEIADGVLQPETAELLESQAFRDVVAGILFTASDAMGAVAGYAWLTSRNLPVIGLSGVLTSSPLQRRESSIETRLPVYSRQDLGRAKTAIEILNLAEGRLAGAGHNGAAAKAVGERNGAHGRWAPDAGPAVGARDAAAS